ncbi:MAG: hydantoinase/oxoprolinase family protein [Candidatus Altiarchaeota archaeon]
MRYLTLDVGGANLKSALVVIKDGKTEVESYGYDYFPVWKRKDLTDYLRKASPDSSFDHLAVTFTAEVSDAFPDKKTGVEQIISSVASAFPWKDFLVLSNKGELLTPSQAVSNYLKVASANWYASAYLASRLFGNGIHADMGSTTTDLIPVINGKVSAEGKTDLERLASSELVYTGALRSSLSALSSKAPLNGRLVGVANEYFACTGDVYTLLGLLREKDYISETPDGRGKSRKECMQRIARLFLADGCELDEKQLKDTASYYMQEQLKLLGESIKNIALRDGVGRRIIGSGIGVFLLEKAARKTGMQYASLSSFFGDAHVAAPCIGLACLIHDGNVK